MSTTGLRNIGLAPKQWDRIMAALLFAANYSRDHCTRANNIELAKEIERRLARSDQRERATEAARRYRERQKQKLDPRHDPDANNLEFNTRHPMERSMNEVCLVSWR
jgi:hypothetical protein